MELSGSLAVARHVSPNPKLSTGKTHRILMLISALILFADVYGLRF